MRRVTALALATGGALAVGAIVRSRIQGRGSIMQTLVAQGVKPSGPLGWLVAWSMPLFFGSLYREVARLLDLRPDDEVLDVACGSGVFLHRYAGAARRIAGLDHSEVQIQLAQRLNQARIRAGAAEFVQGDSAALPWGDGSFSAVTCNCLDCFAQPLRSLQEMHRVLRPGGRLVLSIDFQPDAASARKAERRWALPAWTEDELRHLMADAGFPQVSRSHDKSTLFAKAVKAPHGGEGN